MCFPDENFCGNPLDEGCETAFAEDSDQSTCFIKEGFKRWGWTNGPYPSSSPATYTAKIWAGAGQCDTGKGIEVGSAQIVVKPGGTVDVTVEIFDTWEMTELHIQVSCDTLKFALKNNGDTTVAPGQYTYVCEGTACLTPTTVTFGPAYNIIEGISGESSSCAGNFWVIIHAVTCKGTT